MSLDLGIAQDNRMWGAIEDRIGSSKSNLFRSSPIRSGLRSPLSPDIPDRWQRGTVQLQEAETETEEE